MRGLAAFIVILLHLKIVGLGSWAPDSSYLAVDLFFGLSGFVLAYNYDKRFARGLTVRKFLWQRVRRLFPLYYLGLVLSVFVIPISRFSGAWRWCATIAMHLLLLPGAFSPDLFPVDVPAWSLFFEFWIANVCFALCWRWLHGKRLLVFLGLITLMLLRYALMFHTLDMGSRYPLISGAFPRTLFSFYAGVWMARYYQERKPAFRLPRSIVLAIMLAVFSLSASGFLETAQLACVFFVFPALLYLGAASDKKHSPLMEWLGDASYAAYALHWPVLLALAQFAKVQHWKIAAWQQFVIAILVMVMAYGVHCFLDVPVRRWITRTWPL